jgi:putative transposase
LCAWIDHFSRYSPFSAYYPTQGLLTLEDGFRKALLRGGVPSRFYVDNAKIYHATTFTFACAQIGSELVHSKPYVKESRGVIERFFGDGDIATFERELLRRGVASLNELNTLFWAWLEEIYHRRIHSEIGIEPYKRREGYSPAFPDAVVLSELFLAQESRKVNRKLSTVEVLGAAFHTDPSLRGKTVRVHFDPHDLSSVIIYYNNRRIGRAPRALPNTAPATPPPEPGVSSGFDYLGKILIDHEHRRTRDARRLDFCEIEPTRTFDLEAFEKHLAIALTRPLKPTDQAHTRPFFERYSPLSERLVTVALERAQTARGRGLHVTVYLDFVKEFHIRRGDR